MKDILANINLITCENHNLSKLNIKFNYMRKQTKVLHKMYLNNNMIM